MNMRSQQGALLISLIVTMVIMAALSGGMLYYSSSSSYGELLTNRQARAYYLGESGLNYALQQFNPNTNYTNGPFYPGPVAFNLSNGQFSVKTYDKPGDPTRLVVESTGIVDSGWLTTRQLVTKIFLKSSPILPGQVPTAPIGFDTNTNGQLDTTWAPTLDTSASIVSTGPSTGPALQFQGETGTINLTWNTSEAQAAGAPNLYDAWINNGNLLSYALQVKININSQGTKGSNYLLGLSFRKIDENNFYGVSFYRSAGLSPPGGLPAWCTSALTGVLPNDSKVYAVFWEMASGSVHVLAYALMDYTTYGVTTDATNQNLQPWSSLFIKVNERFDGTNAANQLRRNHLKAYVIGPALYPIGTSNWNFSSLKQITWTWVTSNYLDPPQTAAATQTAAQILDQRFTSFGFSTSRPEIGVHAYYDTNAANDQFFNGFQCAIQGTATGTGGYQY